MMGRGGEGREVADIEIGLPKLAPLLSVCNGGWYGSRAFPEDNKNKAAAEEKSPRQIGFFEEGESSKIIVPPILQRVGIAM